MSVVPNTIAGEAMPDARDVFSESLSYLGLDKTGYAFFSGALFPELYEDTLSELPKSSRWTFLELACTLDVKIISFG
jgi:hypothetical protein